MTCGEKLIREFYQLHPMPWEYDTDLHGIARLPVHDSNGVVVDLRTMLLFISAVKMEIEYKDWEKWFVSEGGPDGD